MSKFNVGDEVYCFDFPRSIGRIHRADKNRIHAIFEGNRIRQLFLSEKEAKDQLFTKPEFDAMNEALAEVRGE